MKTSNLSILLRVKIYSHIYKFTVPKLISNQTTNDMEERSVWEANSSSASHEILSICWDPKVHHCTLFKKACQWSLLWIRQICCTPYPPLSSESILSSYLHHISQVAPFLQIFPLKSCMHFNVLPCMPIPYPYHPLLDHPNNVWWAAHIMKLLMIKLYSVYWNLNILLDNLL